MSEKKTPNKQTSDNTSKLDKSTQTAGNQSTAPLTPAKSGDTRPSGSEKKPVVPTSNNAKPSIDKNNERKIPPSSQNGEGKKAALTPAATAKSTTPPTSTVKPSSIDKTTTQHSIDKHKSAMQNGKKTDAANGAKNAPGKDSKPAAPQNTGTKPPSQPASSSQPPKKSGNGVAWLALILGALGIGVGGYSYTLVQAQQTQTDTAVQKAERAARDHAQLSQTVDAVKATLGNTSQGLDKAEVSQLIAQAVSDLKSQLGEPPQPLDEAQINTLITSRLNEQANTQRPGIAAGEVKAMIAAALADSGQRGGDHVDLSEQIDAFNHTRQQAQDALAQLTKRGDQLDQHAAELEKNLAVTAQTLGEKLKTQTIDADPRPLLNILNLAAIAADSHHYSSAARYLEQALNAYPTFHLDQPPYAGFKTDIAAAQQAYATLAEQDNGDKQLAILAQESTTWPFKSGNMIDEVAKQGDISKDTFAGKAQHFGSKILSKAFTVSKNDEAGLTWINANPILQNTIRENVRLDLAYARNAAVMGDYVTIKATVDGLIPQIERYFDNNAEQVKNALETLKALPSTAPEVPDIGKISDAITKASGAQS